jgi:hypothetical protein
VKTTPVIVKTLVTSALLALAAVAGLAACGSPTAGHGGTQAGPSASSLTLATSVGGVDEPGWAAVEMGGSARTYENFWELFARPAGSAQWKLVTPAGVASNGGIMMSDSSSGLVAGFGPTQDLTFSPLAAAASPTAAWSQGSAPVSPGLASVPDALAAGPSDQVLALTQTGEVLLGSHGGTTWTRLVTLKSAAASPAARSCGLTGLTAVAFSPAGMPMVAGPCRRTGKAGIFVVSQGSLQSVPTPALPGSATAGPVTVLALSSQDGRTTALIRLGDSKDASIVAAWWTGGSSPWTVSSPLATGADAARSAALWPGGGAGVVLAAGRGDTISGPGASWRSLPALPARTATLAAGQDGQVLALAANPNLLIVWQLGSSGTWTQAQVIKVTVPYGTSS